MKKPKANQSPKRPRKSNAKRWAKVKPDDPLTEKEEIFKAEYLVHLNATRAYDASHPGCTNGTCRTEGCKLLAKPNVRAAVDKELETRKERLGIKADDVVRTYQQILDANMGDYAEITKRGGLKFVPFNDLNRDQLAAIQEVAHTKEGIKIKLYDRKGVADALRQHVGLDRPQNPEAPKPGDPGTMTHFHVAVPFDQIQQNAEKSGK